MKKQKLLNITDKIIIDIRDTNDFILNHLNNTINIPYANLLDNYSNLLNKNIIYLLLCYNGITSKLASKRINKAGFKTKYIRGGYNKLS